MQPVGEPGTEVVAAIADASRVPLWMPWPLPGRWLCTGAACVGEERTGFRATAVACAGPAPLGGPGELVVVAEEIGVGLGARYAGLEGPDPGPVNARTVATAKIDVAGHPTPLWWLAGPEDRAVFVGEAGGCWLWVILWPGDTGHLMYDEDFAFIDLREVGAEIAMVPFGALTPRLAG